MKINPALLLGRTKKEVITRAFEANQEINPIPLTLPGYHAQYLVKVSLYVRAGSTPSPHADYPGHIIKSLKVEPTNVAPFLELDDGRELYYEDYIRAEGSLYTPGLPEANEAKWVKFQFPIHPGDEYREDYDISDVIAARGLTNLSFKMKWGSEDDLGEGYTIEAADDAGVKSKIELEICYVVLQPGILETQAFPGRALPGRTPRPSFWQPQWHVHRVRDITSTYDTLSLRENFLNGFFLREVLMMVVRNETDDLVDNIVTELQIANKEGKDFLTKDWQGLENDNMRDFHLSAPLTGVAWIDLKEIFHRTAAGIYLASAADLQWKFTIENVSLANPGTIILVYRTHDLADARTDVKGERPAEFVA